MEMKYNFYSCFAVRYIMCSSYLVDDLFGSVHIEVGVETVEGVRCVRLSETVAVVVTFVLSVVALQPETAKTTT